MAAMAANGRHGRQMAANGRRGRQMAAGWPPWPPEMAASVHGRQWPPNGRIWPPEHLEAIRTLSVISG